MTGSDLVDPELKSALEMRPSFEFSRESLAAVRAALTQMRTTLPEPGSEVQPEERFVPGPSNAPKVRVLVWRPKGAAENLPAILHLHGGGYIVGSPEMMAAEHHNICVAHNCVIVSVDYRLAPESPYPAPIEDCYAALKWLYQNSRDLGVDEKRIGVSGESAGGGLAAALALLARDRGEVSLAFQHLIYPMLDDRTCSREDPHPCTGQYVWTVESNRFGWTSLLGCQPGGADISPYAAAARAHDLSGLPPAFIAVGALDLFLDENIDYALRLTKAGVAVELHVYPGAYHGFQVASDARVSISARRDSQQALAKFLTE